VVPLVDDLRLQAGDTLAVTGTQAQLQSVEALCAGPPNGAARGA
jgi:hypothetical protein